jgi:hypothetical protein
VAAIAAGPSLTAADEVPLPGHLVSIRLPKSSRGEALPSSAHPPPALSPSGRQLAREARGRRQL